MELISGQYQYNPYHNVLTEQLQAQAKRSPDVQGQSPVQPQINNSASYSVDISSDARDMARQENGATAQNSEVSRADASSAKPNGAEGLEQTELRQLATLKQRDTEVRSHEQAHLAAAGQYARGSASFTYQKGPDGNSYAIGGEVGIDVSEAGTPKETIEKMQTIKRAALAPASPSSTDRQIASQATMKESMARQEMMAESHQEMTKTEEDSTEPGYEKEVKNTPESGGASPSYSSLKRIETYQTIGELL